MANNLFTVSAIGATFRPTKNMISLFNSSGSAKIIKVWKVWVLNNQSVALTGVISELRLYRVTAIGGGAALTPVKHNTNISSLPPEIIAMEGATCLLSSLLRRCAWSTDEPVATESNADVVELNPVWNTIWDVPIGSTQIEPLTLNEGEGVSVYFNTNSSVGQADFFINFTIH